MKIRKYINILIIKMLQRENVCNALKMSEINKISEKIVLFQVREMYSI